MHASLMRGGKAGLVRLVDGWMDGWMDGWIDGWMFICFLVQPNLWTGASGTKTHILRQGFCTLVLFIFMVFGDSQIWKILLVFFFCWARMLYLECYSQALYSTQISNHSSMKGAESRGGYVTHYMYDSINDTD